MSGPFDHEVSEIMNKEKISMIESLLKKHGVRITRKGQRTTIGRTPEEYDEYPSLIGLIASCIRRVNVSLMPPDTKWSYFVAYADQRLRRLIRILINATLKVILM